MQNSILETFEYFRQISSKSIHIISSYTVSKLGPFFETQCSIISLKLLLRGVYAMLHLKDGRICKLFCFN